MPRRFAEEDAGRAHILDMRARFVAITAGRQPIPPDLAREISEFLLRAGGVGAAKMRRDEYLALAAASIDGRPYERARALARAVKDLNRVDRQAGRAGISAKAMDWLVLAERAAPVPRSERQIYALIRSTLKTPTW